MLKRYVWLLFKNVYVCDCYGIYIWYFFKLLYNWNVFIELRNFRIIFRVD